MHGLTFAELRKTKKVRLSMLTIQNSSSLLIQVTQMTPSILGTELAHKRKISGGCVHEFNPQKIRLALSRRADLTRALIEYLMPTVQSAVARTLRTRRATQHRDLAHEGAADSSLTDTMPPLTPDLGVDAAIGGCKAPAPIWGKRPGERMTSR